MQIYFNTSLNEEGKKDWNDFWLNCQHSHVRQNYILGEIEKAKGRKPIYVCGKINGQIVCIGIFSIKPFIFNNRFSMEAICLRGPAFDDIKHGYTFLLEVISWCKKINIGRIRISPYWHYPEAEFVESLLNELNFIPINGMHKNRTALVDLQPSKEEILSSFPKRTRHEIRKADQLGVAIKTPENYHEAQEAYFCLRNMRKERGITPTSEKEFHAIYNTILRYQEQGILLIAKIGSIFLGARWSINSPSIAHGAGYAIMPNNLKHISTHLTIGVPLYWKAFQWSKDKGCSWFDLEGPADLDDPTDPLYKISQFKQRFKPIAIDRINEHYFICNNAMYMLHKVYDMIDKVSRFVTSVPYRMTRNG